MGKHDNRKMLKLRNDNENGEVIVEATIVMPVVIIAILAFFYAALFMAQKANLQANLQNALIYYKPQESDTFVEAADKVTFTKEEGAYTMKGNIYSIPEKTDAGKMLPYRFLNMNFDEKKFKEYFLDSCGNMFFYDGTNVDVQVESTNWVLYKKITATATQTLEMPFDPHLAGIDPKLEIVTSAEVVVSDGDNFIRTADMVVYFIMKSELGGYINDLIDKGKDYYDKFCNLFGVKD